jgi:hypothetical protein
MRPKPNRLHLRVWLSERDIGMAALVKHLLPMTGIERNAYMRRLVFRAWATWGDQAGADLDDRPLTAVQSSPTTTQRPVASTSASTPTASLAAAISLAIPPGPKAVGAPNQAPAAKRSVREMLDDAKKKLAQNPTD